MCFEDALRVCKVNGVRKLVKGVIYKNVSRVFQGCSKGVSRVFQGCFKDFSRMLLKVVFKKVTSGCFQGYL